MTDDEQFDELMRRALAEEADRIEPADRLHEIQSRVGTQRKVSPRRPWMIAAGAAVVGTAAAIGAFTMLNNDSTTTSEPEVAGPPVTSTSPKAPATTAPSQAATMPPSPIPTDQDSVAKSRSTVEPEVKGRAVSVYWVGKSVSNDTGPGIRLYRTFTKVSGKPALEAVKQLSFGKSVDRDYYSLWTGSAPLSVTRSDGMVTVDFKALPDLKLEPETANLAVQQLVYTVQGALGDNTAPIRVTERGKPGAILFGTVDTSQPFSRALAADVQALVWISSPAEGDTVASPVTVEGIAATFEAQVNWRAINVKTKETAQGSTMTKAGQSFSAYAFTTKLDRGEWQIEAYLIAPQDGRITDVDSKTIYVR